MSSTTSAMASGFDPGALEQITRAAADFMDTATLTEILIFDAHGNPLPGVTITSASGTAYPLAAAGPPPPGGGPGPVAVPEPPALPLISLGLGMLGGVAWRGCRRRG